MLSFITRGGPFMYILLLFAIFILVLTIQKAIRLFGRKELNDLQAENGLNAILFWGGLSFLLGLYAHFQSIYIALQIIAHAREISPAVVAEGYSASLSTILTGLFIFIVSFIIWFVLRWQLKKLAEAPA